MGNLGFLILKAKNFTTENGKVIVIKVLDLSELGKTYFKISALKGLVSTVHGLLVLVAKVFLSCHLINVEKNQRHFFPPILAVESK